MPDHDSNTKLRLYPEIRVLAKEEGIHTDLQPPLRVLTGRPYVLINMVASVDGRSAVSGRASGIGSRDDRRAMRELRSQADAVMVGAGTLRAEKLNLGLDGRVARQPLAVVVGGAGDLPVGRHLRRGDQDVLLVVPESRAGAALSGQDRASVLRVSDADPGRVALGPLLGVLKATYGIDRLIVEGGPGLNRALLQADLVDEIFLTVAPKILAGLESAILSGGHEAPEQRDLTLLSVHSAGDEIFLRYRVQRPRPPAPNP